MDSLLFDLDSSFGIVELLDDDELLDFHNSQNEIAVQRRLSANEASGATYSDGDIVREAAATSAAAARFEMAAQQAAQLSQRAKQEMDLRRAAAAEAAKYASTPVFSDRAVPRRYTACKHAGILITKG